MKIFDLLASDNYIIINKTLIKEIGLLETIVYCELVSEYRYWKAENKLDENGYFYSTIENLEKNTTFKADKQRSILNHLKSLGLIDFKQKGLPAKRFIKLYNIELEDTDKSKLL